MARAHPVRALTNRVRRKAKRDVADSARDMHLSSSKIGLRSLIGKGIIRAHQEMRAAYATLAPLISLVAVLAHTGRNEHAVVAAYLLLLQVRKYEFSSGRFKAFFRMDHELFDIPPEELANHQSTLLERKFLTIDDWSNQECYQNTGFTQDQLHEIYRLFELEEAANEEPHIGYIAVPNGQGKYHKFPPEEMFLFFMTRMRTGMDKKRLCSFLFGGLASRWTHGWNWILKYLDGRYSRTISHQKLEDYVDDFPDFYRAISAFMEKDFSRHFADGNSADFDGLNFCPFPIFGFIDCSIDKICRPYSGPAGDYVGAPRKPDEDIYQRSVYTGYKKFHGIKVETVMLPNGIMTVFGPVSARIHDTGGVLQMSQLDNFLSQIQQGKEYEYLAFGDGAYSIVNLHCEYC